MVSVPSIQGLQECSTGESLGTLGHGTGPLVTLHSLLRYHAELVFRGVESQGHAIRTGQKQPTRCYLGNSGPQDKD